MESAEALLEAIWPDPDELGVRRLRCRHCAATVRVGVARAVLAPASFACTECGGPLFLARDEPLAGLAASCYQHPLDRRSLESLEAVPGVAALLRRVLGETTERALRLVLESGCVACDEGQCPELVAARDLAAMRLGITRLPPLYLDGSHTANARTMGTREPVVAVDAGLLELVNSDELTAILAHELGHVQSDHLLYHTIGQLVASGVVFAGAVGRLLTAPLQLLLLRWMRCSELTADRAELLGCRDLGVALGLHLALAAGRRHAGRVRPSLRLAPFIAQARRLKGQEESNFLDGALAALVTAGRTHPFAAWRVMHLLDWVEEGSYLEILSGNYDRVPAAREA